MSYWKNQLDNITGSGGQIKVKFTNEEGATKWLNLTSDEFASIEALMLSIEEPEILPERVIFRKFPHNGEVIALFPDQYNERNGNIGSYMHNGQHAETAPDFGDTVPCHEFHALYLELQQQGYRDLKIVQRFGKLGRK